MPDQMDALEACNHTELYQLCQRAGLRPLPQYSRFQLMLLLIEEESEEGEHVIDSWRHGLYGFVSDHWKELQNQISCPLKSKDPKHTEPVKGACFGCLDIQVVACVVTNPTNESQIRKYRQ